MKSNKKLVGLPVYFDTAVVLNKNIPVHLENEQFVRMARNHGVDRVMFGTDTPWYDQKQAVKDMKDTGLTERELELVFGLNARNVFGL